MDLGTMGIPREVAQLNQNENFLFNTNNILGPGDYQPMTEISTKKSPVVGFGKLPSNYKSNTAMWEEKMEKYIGVKPSERGKASPPKEKDSSNLSAMHSFEQ